VEGINSVQRATLFCAVQRSILVNEGLVPMMDC